jgi:hypothetical protein
MKDVTQQCKPNLSTSSPHPTETGERVQPASASGPLYLQANPESIPEKIITLQPWVSWNAEYRPDAGRTKSGAQGPTDAASGRTAQPMAWSPWEACDQAIAAHSIVHRWRQRSLRVYHPEADSSSCQGHVVLARGGLSHG